MMNKSNLTSGSIARGLIMFAIPYLISSFLQTFYGLADLFVIGIFCGAEATTAVSIGSQITHMLTVVIVGLAMGSVVNIANAVGENNERRCSAIIGNTISVFLIFALALMLVLILGVDPILGLLSTPEEAYALTRDYALICFYGVPFIVAYNVISSIFRGLGDTRTPMYIVAFAGVINVALDFLLIGPCHMQAAGAAVATIAAQAISVIVSVLVLIKKRLGIELEAKDLRIDRTITGKLLGVGVPIAVQEGLIQISFLAITAIVNSRGVVAAAGVGIVEKLISFLFLVNSSMLSSVSAMVAQNIGAGKPERGRKALFVGLAVSVSFGLVVAIIVQFAAEPIVGLFTADAAVITMGGQYFRSYVIDCIFAAVHFCFSGYFSGCEKSMYSFIHNMISVILIRIPGAYLTSIWFPDTLYPMGWAAPLGSLLSACICIGLFVHMEKRK